MMVRRVIAEMRRRVRCAGCKRRIVGQPVTYRREPFCHRCARYVRDERRKPV